jgi:hypothetical protein
MPWKYLKNLTYKMILSFLDVTIFITVICCHFCCHFLLSSLCLKFKILVSQLRTDNKKSVELCLTDNRSRLTLHWNGMLYELRIMALNFEFEMLLWLLTACVFDKDDYWGMGRDGSCLPVSWIRMTVGCLYRLAAAAEQLWAAGLPPAGLLTWRSCFQLLGRGFL